MALIHVVVLALVQGLTEFLPISSSGHLVLVWEFFDRANWQTTAQTPAERLIIDVAVHVGTLLAVCLYSWRDVGQMGLGLVKLVAGQATPGARLALHVVVGSLPLVLVGYLFRDDIAEVLHNVRIVAWATIGFGVVLFVADRLGMTVRRVEHMQVTGALFIGLAQVLALVPGTSRAGITMTAARFMGYERPEAARFSLLLAIPAILGAGTIAGLDLYAQDNMRLGLDAVAAAALSCLVALGAITLMIRWLHHAGFTPFVVYRILLGVALLIWVA